MPHEGPDEMIINMEPEIKDAESVLTDIQKVMLKHGINQFVFIATRGAMVVNLMPFIPPKAPMYMASEGNILIQMALCSSGMARCVEIIQGEME